MVLVLLSLFDPCLCVPVVQRSIRHLWNSAHSRRMHFPPYSMHAWFRISKFSTWVTLSSTCRCLVRWYQTWQKMLNCDEMLVEQKKNTAHSNTLAFSCSFTAVKRDFYYEMIEFIWIVPWVCPKTSWIVKVWKDFSLNFYCIITELWWAAAAQRSLRVSCLYLAHHFTCLPLPPSQSLSVSLWSSQSQHHTTKWALSTCTIANLFPWLQVQ